MAERCLCEEEWTDDTLSPVFRPPAAELEPGAGLPAELPPSVAKAGAGGLAPVMALRVPGSCPVVVRPAGVE
jgi:hypothetical protein